MLYFESKEVIFITFLKRSPWTLGSLRRSNLSNRNLSPRLHLGIPSSSTLIARIALSPTSNFLNSDQRISPILARDLRCSIPELIDCIFHKVSCFCLRGSNRNVVSVSSILKSWVDTWAGRRDLLKVCLVQVFVIGLFLALSFWLEVMLYMDLFWGGTVSTTTNAKSTPLICMLTYRASECTNGSAIGGGHLASLTSVETDVVSCLSLNYWSYLRHLFPSRNAPWSNRVWLLRGHVLDDPTLALELNSFRLDYHELSWVELEIKGHLATKLNMRALK